MNHKAYTETLIKVINNHFDKYKEVNGYVDRGFFESKDLRDKAEIARQSFAVLGFPEISDDKFNQLFEAAIRECRHKKQAGMTPSVSLIGKDARKKTWLDPARIQELGWNSETDKVYRNRYMTYLSRIGRSEKYIEETKRSSLEILKKFGDPKSDSPFYVRGLVVGNVQSGKTANFNAVINSAIDTGYDLIIVLSGIMEDLRKQTQRRIEKEVEGKYEKGGFIGVGAVASYGAQGLYTDVQPVIIPTSTETDFKKSIKEADFSLNNKNILVCKKNTGVLKNLLLWLHNYLNENKDKIGIPLLIIDDEADNASLNNLGEKGAEYATKINGHIRAILGLFDKKTYLGYTATPFANILQDRHEETPSKWQIKDQKEPIEFDLVGSLFPKDFIELLFPPPNYIGAKHFFETHLGEYKKIEPLIVEISDHPNAFPARLNANGQPAMQGDEITRAASKDDVFPLYIPDSMKEAVMCFLISTAVRLSRKPIMFDSKVYQPHNTMLIHVSRFTTWQTRTKDLVSDYVEVLRCSLENDFPTGDKTIYSDFERIWYKYYSYIMANIKNYLPDDYEDDFLIPKTFDDIKPLLIHAVKNVEVKAINSLPPKDQLYYPDNEEKTYIAVGGNRLSRGFTLEGLTINYFIRNTDFADTLLQMGRWFGYRPGYIDCCKLFTTQDSLDKYDQVTETIEDLEQKFIDMNKNPSNTPEKYALRVLNHPGYLKITRAAILKNAREVKCSFSDHLLQTTRFKIEKSRIDQAWNAFKEYANFRKDKFIPINPSRDSSYLAFSPENIEDLFALFKLPNTFTDQSFEFQNLEQFIRACNLENKLTSWTIVIKATGQYAPKEVGLPWKIGLTVRGGPNAKDRSKQKFIDERIYIAGGASANIHSGGDFKITLEQPEIDAAEQQFRSQYSEDLRKKYPELSDLEISKKVKSTSVPEKAYRHKMSEKEGIVVIYLIDTKSIFESHGIEISELTRIRNTIDTSVPLVGYAIGIPPINGDIGGTYLESLFHKDESLDDENFDDYVEVLEE